MEQISISSSFSAFENINICVRADVLQDDGSSFKVHSRATISLAKYLNLTETWMLLREPLMRNDENTGGILEGFIRIHNPPIPWQMPEGTLSDGIILNGVLACKGSYDFKDSLKIKCNKLGNPVHSSYDPSSLISSPFETPTSLIRENQIQKHLDILKEPEGEWKSALVNLSILLKDDPMSQKLFQHNDGVETILKLVSTTSNFDYEITEVIFYAVNNC